MALWVVGIHDILSVTRTPMWVEPVVVDEGGFRADYRTGKRLSDQPFDMSDMDGFGTRVPKRWEHRLEEGVLVLHNDDCARISLAGLVLGEFMFIRAHKWRRDVVFRQLYDAYALELTDLINRLDYGKIKQLVWRMQRTATTPIDRLLAAVAGLAAR